VLRRLDLPTVFQVARASGLHNPAICRTITVDGSGSRFHWKMASITTVRQRNQRLEARVTQTQKELIERAACVQGRTVTDFVVGVLQDAAKQAIADHAVWKLTQEQQKVFVDALTDPPAPNQKLREAYKRFRKHKASTRR
jgi:uncharacterized protein (DUF1778 family)